MAKEFTKTQSIIIEGKCLEVNLANDGDIYMNITNEDGSHASVTIRHPYQTSEPTPNIQKALRQLFEAIKLDEKKFNTLNKNKWS